VKKLLVLVLSLGLLAVHSVGRAEMKMDDEKSDKAKKVTLTGTLVDVACYLDDGSTGNDHMGMKKCGTECLKGGSPAGLLVDQKLYILVFPASAFADYVGQKVTLTATDYGNHNLMPVTADAIDKDGKKKKINIKGKAMM